MDHANHALSLVEPGALGLAGALFLAGLFGGIGHCTTMCGPFVLAQLSGEPRGPMLKRLAGWAMLPLQLGRATTYAALGAIAGGFGAAVVKTTGLRWTLATFLLIASILFLLHGLKLLTAGRFSSGVADRIARKAAGLVRAPVGAGTYILGVMLGLLPCGFLYGAVSASAAAGSPLSGAAAMAAFAAGTSASLIAVAVAGRTAATRWRGLSARLAGPVFVANAAIAALLAIRTILGA